MLIARTRQGNWVSWANYTNQEQLRNVRQKENYYCPECNEEVILKIGSKRIPHFAHKKRTVCMESYERESEYHLAGKLSLYKWLKRQGIEATLEKFDPRVGQRPDIEFVYSGSQYAIEYQCSNIPVELFIKRTINFQQANIIPIWIMAGKNIKRQGNSRASLSGFDYLFLRKSHQNNWIIPSFCPLTNTLIVMNKITPVSVKNIITSFTIKNLTNVTLSDLVHPKSTSLQLKDWRTEIKKWKNTVAIYGTPKNRFLQQLYASSLIPQFLPPAIGLPVSHSPYIETSPIQWQSYLFIDVLLKKEYFSLEEIFHSVKMRVRNQDVRIRRLPLSPNNNFNTAVKEYLDLLIKTNMIRKINHRHFKIENPIIMADNVMRQEEIEQSFYQKFSKYLK
ncbi:hypothetical protein KDN24_20630 [Bacillus sp. Bva_UNVM-123]|uniref:competence protein CoiA n=1 Tax=Bacillus sp. Bva_UNVM-123 TaxID=2829798 RepID=UPI00391F3400